MVDLVPILRYRKAVTYGFRVLLGALEEHETRASYEVVFAEAARAGLPRLVPQRDPAGARERR